VGHIGSRADVDRRCEPPSYFFRRKCILLQKHNEKHVKEKLAVEVGILRVAIIIAE